MPWTLNVMKLKVVGGFWDFFANHLEAMCGWGIFVDRELKLMVYFVKIVQFFMNCVIRCNLRSIVQNCTKLKAERKSVTGGWKSWAPKPRPELDSGTWARCMRQEIWHRLQQRWDATICTFLELGKADGQDQAGIEPTQERRCYIVVETKTNTTRESPSSWGKEWSSAWWNGSWSTAGWWGSEWRGSTSTSPSSTAMHRPTIVSFTTSCRLSYRIHHAMRWR